MEEFPDFHFLLRKKMILTYSGNTFCFKLQQWVTFWFDIEKASNFVHSTIAVGSRISSRYGRKIIDFVPQQQVQFYFQYRISFRSFYIPLQLVVPSFQSATEEIFLIQSHNDKQIFYFA